LRVEATGCGEVGGRVGAVLRERERSAYLARVCLRRAAALLLRALVQVRLLGLGLRRVPCCLPFLERAHVGAVHEETLPPLRQQVRAALGGLP